MNVVRIRVTPGSDGGAVAEGTVFSGSTVRVIVQDGLFAGVTAGVIICDEQGNDLVGFQPLEQYGGGRTLAGDVVFHHSLLQHLLDGRRTAAVRVKVTSDTGDAFCSATLLLQSNPAGSTEAPPAPSAYYISGDAAEDLVEDHNNSPSAHPSLGFSAPSDEKVTPALGDGFTLWDSVDSWRAKLFTWAALRTALSNLYAALSHASTHASGGTDPVTLAAIEPSTAAAVPSSAGADNQLVTEADLADLGGGGGLEVVHVVAATLTPESGKHYIAANDVQILAPDTPTGSILWECSVYLEPGVILSYPTGWLVSGYSDSSAANRARISYANGSQWHIDWEAKYETVSGDVIYVSTDGDDDADGRSWASAYRTVHKAFAVAEPGQQVWIAGGDYDAGIANGYALPSGVTVYGGFAGTEGSTAERSRTPAVDGIGASAYAHETVLSNRVDVTPEAAWVCFANQPAGAGNPCTLSGLTVGPSRQGVYCVQAGAAVLVDCLVTGCVYAGTTSDGGGLTNATAAGCTVQNCSAGRNGGGAWGGTLANCVLSGNSAANGGGANSGTLTNCVLSGNSAANGGGAHSGTLTNCVLSGNSATAGGGAHSGTLTNCVLSGNSATAGGGAYQGTLTNCVLSGNSAGSQGGGAYQGTLTNCVLSGNSASSGGGAYQGTLINCLVLHNAPSGAGASALLNVTQRNCILWRNTGTISGTATYTIDDSSLTLAAFADPLDIAAGLPADIPALLAAIQAGGYDVAAGSPVIDAGNNADNTTAYDLLGRPRKVGTIDIGPYEYQGV